MWEQKTSEKQTAAWLAAALAAPVAHGAAGCTWPAALLTGGGCLALCWFAPRLGNWDRGWLGWLRSVCIAAMVCRILYWMRGYWPGQTTPYVLPLTLLALTAWAAGSGRDRVIRTGCVLLWPLMALFGAVVISGIPEVKWSNLTPSWKMTDADLLMAMLIPLLREENGEGKQGWVLLGAGAAAVVISVVSAGVLSAGAGIDTPMYELSRSLSLLGIGERLESLIAAGMTLGCFTAMGYLLAASGEPGMGSKRLWCTVILGAVLFVLGIPVDSRWIAIGIIVLWVILPGLGSLKNSLGNMKKGVDK